MRDFLISLFGEYTPVTHYVTEAVGTGADGSVLTETYEVVASGAAGLDWPWIAGFVLFAIVLYSFFRILGVLFK